MKLLDMIANGKALLSLIDNILKPLGYVKKKDTWYLHTEECILFFTIDKSPYGGQYGEGFGCFLKELEITWNNKETPPYYKSHLRISLLFFVGNEIVYPLFDLENNSFTNDEREKAIVELVEKYAIPFLNGIQSKEGILETYKKDPGLKITCTCF